MPDWRRRRSKSRLTIRNRGKRQRSLRQKTLSWLYVVATRTLIWFYLATPIQSKHQQHLGVRTLFQWSMDIKTERENWRYQVSRDQDHSCWLRVSYRMDYEFLERCWWCWFRDDTYTKSIERRIYNVKFFKFWVMSK